MHYARVLACFRVGINFGSRRAIGVVAVLLSVALPTLNATAEGPKRASKDPFDLAAYDAAITDADRAHWSFQPVRRRDVPEVKNRAWVRNPIDGFVRAKLEEQGWRPAAEASPRALVRRVYLDVTGLPPTPDEQEAFLRATQTNPTAYEKLVDDLLARPTFGERWARRWLDLVRFAETNGYERDATKPFAWRYRDYVIRAFNQDKPFDRFLTEQLAGDELPDGPTAETLVATGFFRLGPWDDEPADPKQDRFDHLDDLVVTTSEVFLGLTLGCARCHDHKFEPLTSHDYYRMAAVFAPLDRPRKERTELDSPIGNAAELAAGTPNLPRGYFLREPSSTPSPSYLLIRGQAAAPGPKVAPGVPAVLARVQPEFTPATKTSGRRLGLARWLTRLDNPLTARVIVNRVWQGHLGAGLVRTPSDFGTMTDPPTHPELLDWLASRFVEEGWSLKRLHRLILTSATYRMGVTNVPKYAEEDPDDLLLWRRPYHRLEAEPIRDAMLAASGRLDQTMYGPSMYPFIPAEAVEASSDPDPVWPPFVEATTNRRTIYAFIKRSLVVPMLDLLDLCDTARSAARRNVTSVPTQALTLLNGDFVNRQSRLLADRLKREADDEASRVDRAFLLTLCRPPTVEEREAALQFIKEESWTQFCRALFNTNEFVYPD